MAKKITKKVDNKLNLESILMNCREYLRSNATLNDKRDLLLTLVFLRFIGEKFEDAQIAMREECIKHGIDDEAVIDAFLNSPARYQNVAYVPEAARWGNIINIPAAKLNAALDDALQAIDDSGEALKGCVRKGLFSSINLEANVIKKVVDEVNKMAELGTQLAHVDGGVPNIRISIPELNAYYIGQLLYFFEIGCGISGYVLGVNPFNQPGVEAYKKNMFALLDKPGYEEESKAIRARL